MVYNSVYAMGEILDQYGPPMPGSDPFSQNHVYKYTWKNSIASDPSAEQRVY